MRRPALSDFVIPVGIAGGALVGLLLAVIDLPDGTSVKDAYRGDPKDSLGMLAVFYIFAGAIAGTLVGLAVAITLYFKKRRRMN
jgi:hypothetical protein